MAHCKELGTSEIEEENESEGEVFLQNPSPKPKPRSRCRRPGLGKEDLCGPLNELELKQTPTAKKNKVGDDQRREHPSSEAGTDTPGPVMPSKATPSNLKNDPEPEMELEFGGPAAVRNTMVLMPLTVFTLNWMCNKESCSLFVLPGVPGVWDLVDLQAWGLYLGWLAFLLLLHRFLPGHIKQGQPLADGSRLNYKLNGWLSLLTSLAVFALAAFSGWPVDFVYRKFFALMMAAMLCSCLLSAAVYLKSRTAPDSQLNPAANTGHVLYDAYMGRELNPRIGDLDLKFFCELRPGLIGWIMLDLSFIAHAWQEMGHIPPSLLLVSLFHFLYVADALYFEDTVLTTLDLTTEGFGFMLAFGDLTFAPFLFSLSARFLLEHPQPWSTPALAALLALNGLGYWIFRSANSEKDRFRNDPEHAEFKGAFIIMTSSGQRLLASGWWGMCRHPNYLGDIIMALTWTITTGCAHALPCFYLVYLVGTLVHRSGRDHKRCAAKYGRDWQRYCAAVPYVILPGVF